MYGGYGMGPGGPMGGGPGGMGPGGPGRFGPGGPGGPGGMWNGGPRGFGPRWPRRHHHWGCSGCLLTFLFGFGGLVALFVMLLSFIF